MKQAIILHGKCSKAEYMADKYPSLSNSHWLPWLQKQLLVKGWHAHTPEVIDAYEPTHKNYLTELNRYNLDEDTTLIGYSCGAGFLIRYLSENPNLKLDKVILVAPWLNIGKEDPTDMFEFEIDPTIHNRTNKLVVIYSTDDMEMIIKSIYKLKDILTNVEFVEFSSKQHFNYAAIKTEGFPELLDLVIS